MDTCKNCNYYLEYTGANYVGEFPCPFNGCLNAELNAILESVEETQWIAGTSDATERQLETERK